MTSIRTTPPQTTPPQTTAPQQRAIDPARLAAQRAFFAAAMGQSSAPAVAPPITRTEAKFTVPPRTLDIPTEAPARLLRPGSILDIRV